jgi:hypothetical protein
MPDRYSAEQRRIWSVTSEESRWWLGCGLLPFRSRGIEPRCRRLVARLAAGLEGLDQKPCDGRRSRPGSRSSDEQWKHTRAARELRIGRLEVLPQLSPPNQRAGFDKRVLQTDRLPKGYVEERVAEVGPLGLVLTPERGVVGISRGNNEHVGARQTRDEDPGKASRDDNHFMPHTGRACRRGETALASPCAGPP